MKINGLPPAGFPGPDPFRPSVQSFADRLRETAPEAPSMSASASELAAVAGQFTRADLDDPTRADEAASALATEIIKSAAMPDDSLAPEDVDVIAGWMSQDPILRETLDSLLRETL